MGISSSLKQTFLLAVLLIGALALPNTIAQGTRQLTQGPVKRTALVIGNARYQHARQLTNSVNDAQDMAKALRSLGFDVIEGEDLSLREMNTRVRDFGDRLKANGGVGLFYYAGHGVQVSGRNFLIPIDAALNRPDEVEFGAVNVDLVLRKLDSANNGFNIVILDACRNNPFERSWSRGASEEGLAQISAPTGTFIAYSTAPEKTASDGTGRNGLYTQNLLQYMRQPNLKIEELFKEVRKAVAKASDGAQVPWDASSLQGDFYFAGSSASQNFVVPNYPKPLESTPLGMTPQRNESFVSFAKVMNPSFAEEYSQTPIQVKVKFVAPGQTEGWIFGAIPQKYMNGRVAFRVVPFEQALPAESGGFGGVVPPHVFIDKAGADVIFSFAAGDTLLLTGKTVVGKSQYGGFVQVIFIASDVKRL